MCVRARVCMCVCVTRSLQFDILQKGAISRQTALQLQAHVSLQLQQEQMAKDAQEYAAAAALCDADSASSDAGVEHILEDQARALTVWKHVLAGVEDILDDGFHRRIQDLEAEVDVLWRNIVRPTAREVFEHFLSQVHTHRVSLSGAVGTGAFFE